MFLEGVSQRGKMYICTGVNSISSTLRYQSLLKCNRLPTTWEGMEHDLKRTDRPVFFKVLEV